MASIVTVKEGPCGGIGGSVFHMDPTDINRIVTIRIRSCDDAIVAIQLWFERNGNMEHTPQWGGNFGNLTEIKFGPNEYIKSVRGYVGYIGELFLVKSLELITNLNNYGPYGMEAEKGLFELTAPKGKIIAFRGRSGDYLDAIGVYVQEGGATSN